MFNSFLAGLFIVLAILVQLSGIRETIRTQNLVSYRTPFMGFLVRHIGVNWASLILSAAPSFLVCVGVFLTPKRLDLMLILLAFYVFCALYIFWRARKWKTCK